LIPLRGLQILWVLQPNVAGLLQFRALILLLATHFVYSLVDDLHDVKLVKSQMGIGKIVGYAFDEGWRHVTTKLSDFWRLTLMVYQVIVKSLDRWGIFALCGKQHFRGCKINKQRYIVVTTLACGFIHTDGGDCRVVLLVARLLDIVVNDAPDTGVMLSDHSSNRVNRHGLCHHHDHCLKQKREAALRARPGKWLQLENTTFRAGYPRYTSSQISHVLKEVEMPPRRLCGIIGFQATTTTFRATEGASRRKVDFYVQPLLVSIEWRWWYSPWQLKPQSQLKQFKISHNLDGCRMAK